MEIYFVIFYIIITCLLLICTRTIKKYKNELDEIVKFDDNEFLLYFDDLDMNKVSIIKGKFYAYNPIRNQIIFEDKKEYSYYDVFGMSHEIGHYIDNKNKKVLRSMIPILIYRCVLVPTYGVTVLGSFFDLNYIRCVRESILYILIFFSIFKMFYIFKYEVSASKYAVERIGSNCDCIIKIKIISKLCVVQQFVFTLQCILFFVFIDMLCKELNL